MLFKSIEHEYEKMGGRAQGVYCAESSMPDVDTENSRCCTHCVVGRAAVTPFRLGLRLTLAWSPARPVAGYVLYDT